METINYSDGSVYYYFTSTKKTPKQGKRINAKIPARLLTTVNWYRVANVGGGKFELWFQCAFEAGTDVWLSGYNSSGQACVVLPNGRGIYVSKAEVEVKGWPAGVEPKALAGYEALATIPAQVVDGECGYFSNMRKFPNYQASQAEQA